MDITLKITITEKSFELLKQIEKAGGAEFRDSEYESLEQFKKSNFFNTPIIRDLIRDEEWFKRRNFCDLCDLEELIQNNFIDIGDGMAWNLTYEVSELGKKMLLENKTKGLSISALSVADLNHYVINAAMNIMALTNNDPKVQEECGVIIDTVRKYTKGLK